MAAGRLSRYDFNAAGPRTVDRRRCAPRGDAPGGGERHGLPCAARIGAGLRHRSGAGAGQPRTGPHPARRPGTTRPPTATASMYPSAVDPVEIAGAGREGPGATIINAPSGAFRTLALGGGSGSLIHDVRVDLPIGTVAGGTGLQTAGTARHVMVFAKDTQQSNGRSRRRPGWRHARGLDRRRRDEVHAGVAHGRRRQPLHHSRLRHYRQSPGDEQPRRARRAVPPPRRDLRRSRPHES